MEYNIIKINSTELKTLISEEAKKFRTKKTLEEQRNKVVSLLKECDCENNNELEENLMEFPHVHQFKNDLDSISNRKRNEMQRREIRDGKIKNIDELITELTRVKNILSGIEKGQIAIDYLNTILNFKNKLL